MGRQSRIGDKSVNMIDKEAVEKEVTQKSYSQRIANLKQWLNLYARQVNLAEREIVLKGKAPLAIEAQFEYEKLPDWQNHLKEAYDLAIQSNILKIKAEMQDITNQIERLERESDEL